MVLAEPVAVTQGQHHYTTECAVGFRLLVILWGLKALNLMYVSANPPLEDRDSVMLLCQYPETQGLTNIQ